MSTGMEKKEIEQSPDIFWSREPIMGPRGTKENPAIVPSYNTSRCVGLETEQVCAANRAMSLLRASEQQDAAVKTSEIVNAAALAQSELLPLFCLYGVFALRLRVCVRQGQGQHEAATAAEAQTRAHAIA